jgi:DNA-binding NarL/FixJ family response regulator
MTQKKSCAAPLAIFICDPHDMIRAGLRKIIEEVAGVKVVGEAGTAPQAIQALRRDKPDVLVLEPFVPGFDGLEAAAWIRDNHWPTRVLVLSMEASPGQIRLARSMGVAGYLLKAAAPETLGIALRAVAGGTQYFCELVSGRLAALPEDDASIRPVLTGRQQQVLGLVVAGKTSRQIADVLGISVRTVESHRAAVMERLGVTDTVSLVRVALYLDLARQ